MTPDEIRWAVFFGVGALVTIAVITAGAVMWAAAQWRKVLKYLEPLPTRDQ